MTPVLHVSQRFPASRLCAAAGAAAGAASAHRQPRDRVRPRPGSRTRCCGSIADEIADRLYTPAADLPEGEQRIALKEIHLNRCPALVAWDHLRAAGFRAPGHRPGSRRAPRAARIRDGRPGTGRERCARCSRSERDARARRCRCLALRRFHRRRRQAPVQRRSARRRRRRWASASFGFRDARLPELLFRYRARNWPQTLSLERARRAGMTTAASGCATSAACPNTASSGSARRSPRCALAHAEDAGKLALLDQLRRLGPRDRGQPGLARCERLE